MVAGCGDDIINGAETCDDGDTDNSDSCPSNCQIARCGDGFLRTGMEQCDDGNTQNGDACESNCTLPVCGNGIIDSGETCDDGNQNANDACPTNCRNAACGDGFLFTQGGFEECDDQNTVPGDGCTSQCKNEKCGDGVVNNGGAEQCDDGNVLVNDGCDNSCQIEILCGNGVLNPGEQCDDGNTQSNDGCSATCQNEIISINCVQGTINSQVFNNVPDGFTLELTGACNPGPVTLTGKRFVVKGLGGAEFIGDSPFTIGGASKITFKDINFSVDTGVSAILVKDSGKVVLVNVTMENSDNSHPSRYVKCSNLSKVLLDRVLIHNHAGDEAIEAVNDCQMIVANSIFADSVAGKNKDTFKLNDNATVQILFSTFIRNDNSEENGIAEIASGNLTLNSVIGANNGLNPLSAAPEVGSDFNFIDVESFVGNTTVDPLIDTNTFHILPGSPAADEGDPNPSLTSLVFNPFNLFGVNIFDHDKNNDPRPLGNRRDSGAFEIF